MVYINTLLNRINGRWLVLMAAILWGTTGTAQAFAPDGAEPTTVGALRLLIGGATLFLIAHAEGAFKQGGEWHKVATPIAIVSVATYQICFFAGVDRAGVAIGTIVGIGSAPIMGGLLGYLVRGERLNQTWFISTALAIIGCILLTAPSSASQENVDLVGVLLALGAGLSYAIYTVASKTLLETHPSNAVMAVIFCAGAVLLSPLLFTSDLGWVMNVEGVVIVAHLGIIATGLSYVLFGRGLITVTTGTATTLSLSEPLTAGILGVVVLEEHITPIAVLGMILLFMGLGVLTLNRQS